ncbi:MAG: QueT transporter family protein [Peptostreptococcaceae bacterium]|nr:QueT transporter family protein [Peptostreptococcaceae bacterium]
MNKKTEKIVYNLVFNALIAGLYAVLTVAIAPISYGAVQFRLSEIMTLLVLYNPAFAPGLIVGCFIANIFSPFGVIDMIVGTIATAIAVLSMTKIKNALLASLMPTISNGLIIGTQLWYLLGLPLFETILYVAFGEFVVVTIVGLPLFKIITQRIPIKSEAH